MDPDGVMIYLADTIADTATAFEQRRQATTPP
jgi:hypothetical protein